MEILLFGILPGFITGVVVGWLGTIVWLIWDVDDMKHKRREEERKQ